MELMRAAGSAEKMGKYLAGMETSSAELVKRWDADEGKRKRRRVTAARHTDAKRRSVNRELIHCLGATAARHITSHA